MCFLLISLNIPNDAYKLALESIFIISCPIIIKKASLLGKLFQRIKYHIVEMNLFEKLHKNAVWMKTIFFGLKRNGYNNTANIIPSNLQVRSSFFLPILFFCSIWMSFSFFNLFFIWELRIWKFEIIWRNLLPGRDIIGIYYRRFIDSRSGKAPRNQGAVYNKTDLSQ